MVREKAFLFTEFPAPGRRFEFGAEIAHYSDEAGPNLTKEIAMKPTAKPTKKGKNLGAKKLQKKVTLWSPSTPGTFKGPGG